MNLTKTTITFSVALIFFALFMSTPVVAVTSQGLYWGFDIGDRFDFQYIHEKFWDEYEIINNLDFYVVIDGLSPINDPIDNLPSISWSCYALDGAPSPLEIYSTRKAFPIGNCLG